MTSRTRQKASQKKTVSAIRRWWKPSWRTSATDLIVGTVLMLTVLSVSFCAIRRALDAPLAHLAPHAASPGSHFGSPP